MDKTMSVCYDIYVGRPAEGRLFLFEGRAYMFLVSCRYSMGLEPWVLRKAWEK